MSTFVFHLNDSIAVSDSLMRTSSNFTDVCLPYVKGMETNWADVEIAKWICLTIIVVALITATTIFLCYRRRLIAEQKQKNFDNQQVQEDNKQQREIEKDKYEESPKGNGLNNQKSDTEKAMEILKDIAILSRDKDAKTDNEMTTELYKLFKEIKKDLELKDNER